MTESKIEEFSDNKESEISKHKGLNVGDIFISDRGGFIRIDSFIDDDGYNGDCVGTSHSSDGINDWSYYGNPRVNSFLSNYEKINIPTGLSIEEAVEDLYKDVAKAMIDSSFLDMELEESDGSINSLVVSGGTERLEQVMDIIETKKKRVEIIKRLAEKKLDEFRSIANKFQNQLGRIMRVVDILELYLGVSEEVFQLTAGEPASKDEVIGIRQLILYMDEEAGILEIFKRKDGIEIQGDIDWMNIESFDEWITTDNNIDIVLPEKKGIVAIKPSRQSRERYGTGREREQNERNNRMVYLLIRNGDNLYRVWIETSMGDFLFQPESESEKIEKMFSEANTEWDKEKIQDTQMSGARNALIIQGIIDRTTLFHPLSKPIVLSDPDTYKEGGQIKLIRDGEASLTDGRQSYKDWKDDLNSMIKRGTRVFYSGIGWSKDGHNNRFARYYYNRFSEPPTPAAGILSIDSVETKKRSWRSGEYEVLVVRYNPKDMVSGSWYNDPHERQNRVSFYLYKDDEFVLNYDLLDLDDVIYYLNSRLERPNYLSVLPMLKSIYEQRLDEIEEEKMFVKLFAQEMKCDVDIVWEAVDWWKNKVIFKRPLDEDDEKAWRMIRGRIKKKMKETN